MLSVCLTLRFTALQGITPLMRAAKRGDVDAVKLLLAAKADIDASNKVICKNTSLGVRVSEQNMRCKMASCSARLCRRKYVSVAGNK